MVNKYKDRYYHSAEYQRKRRAKTQGKAMSGALWTPEEDALVIAHNVPDYELSEILQRSEMAIQLRRFRLGETNGADHMKFVGRRRDSADKQGD